MRYLLAIILVVFLIPSVSVEGADREWVATEPEGSCNRNGFVIQNETIQVTEDSIFSFNFFFRQLPENLVFRGNLIDGKTELTSTRPNGGIRVGSFISEQSGKNWKLKIKWLFTGRAGQYVPLPVCDTFFALDKSS